MGSLTGKVALITGGASGLGASIASVFIREGARVVVGDIKGDAASVTVEEGGEPPGFIELDVTSPQAWEAAVATIVGEHARLDILVNNAGVITYRPLLTTSYEEYGRQIGVNQNGVFLGLKAVLPTMIEAGAGAVVNVASTDAIVPVPGTAPYAASKHAVLGLTKAAAVETATLGVRVNAVCPGVMATPMALEADLSELGDVDLAAVISKVPMQRVADPSEIAEVIAFLASDRASYCTGSYIAVDGGWTAVAAT
jgi:3alpha(or 20beta)-hydroxysteroid dehydrogenase